MAAFDLMGEGLADIMQQACTPGSLDIGAQLGSHHAGEVGYLQRVLQHVLTIAGTIAHPAQQAYQLGMDVVNAGFVDGPFAVLLDLVVHFPLGLLHHFLDAGRVDASILDQPLQGDPGHFPAHRVMAGQGDGLGGIVDDEIHTGEVLQGTDIAAFTTDDAALHLIIGQRHYRYGHFGYIVRSAALDRARDDLPGLLVSLVLQTGFHLADAYCLFMGQFIFEVLEQVFLGLVGGITGDLFQQFKLLLLDLLRFCQTVFRFPELSGKLLLFFLHILGLFVQAFLPLLQAALLPGHLIAAVLDLPVRIAAQLEDLVLGLHQSFLLLALGGLDGVAQDPLGLFLGRTQFGFRHFSAVCNTGGKCNDKSHQQSDQRDQNVLHRSCQTSFQIFFQF